MLSFSGDLTNDTSRATQTLIVMRHGIRLDGEDVTWYRTAARPYDTPITGAGKQEAFMVAKSRCEGKVRTGMMLLDLKRRVSLLRCRTSPR